MKGMDTMRSSRTGGTKATPARPSIFLQLSKRPHVFLALAGTLAFVSAYGQETLCQFTPFQLKSSSLIQANDGNFYGATYWGGAHSLGTLYRITPGGALTTLVSFNGTNGGHPFAGLVQGSDGDLYGTTYYGGDLTLNGGNGFGTVFKVTLDGQLTSLVQFANTNGSYPSAKLLQGGDGNFYGTTYSGGVSGRGTVFQMTPAGALTTVASFAGTNGGHPSAGLVQGNDGNFYGTTYWGGNLALGGGSGLGTVFKMSPAGAITRMVAFGGANGGHPYAEVTQGSDGNFYGTTDWGGNTSLGNGSGLGTVFRMTPGGALSTLVAFAGTNGGHPYAALVQGPDGNFYGTTYWGGNLLLNSGNGYGTAFNITPAGAVTTLVSFTAENGAYPFGGLVPGSNNRFYGTTTEGGAAGGGTFFRLDLSPSLSIVQQPDDLSVSLGANAVFQANAYSADPPAYHWYFNGVGLLNATNPVLTLAGIQLSNAGSYTVVVTNTSSALTSRVALLQVDPAFTKVMTGSIVTNLGTGTACAWGDYDGDGFCDLIVTSAYNPNNSTGQKNLVFHNNGDGTFSSVASASVGLEARDWRGCSWVDVDNDGRLDLYVTSTTDNGFPAENELFRNNGDGTFTKMSAAAVGAIVPGGGSSQGPVWADINRDGFVDLYIARAGTGWLFTNNSAGIFSQVTNGAVAQNQANRGSYTAAWSDYLGTGWPDLFVTAKDDSLQNQTNFLYSNAGGGLFNKITSGPVVTDNDYSVGCAWVDVNNLGYPDLFVVNGLDYLGTCSFYRNNTDGSFTKLTAADVGSIASDQAFFAQCAWGDYDNDGYLDVIVTVLQTSAVNYLYHNNGDGIFTRVMTGSLVRDRGASVGCAWADINNDGFLDLFVARGTHLLPTANLLYLNNGNSNAWLRIKLAGTVSNRSAIGAKVRVHATIRGKDFWQLREINTGDGYCAGPLEAHFGLGDATNVDTVRIEWPSGLVQEFHDVAPRQILTYTEPPRLLASAGAAGQPPQFSLKGGRFMQYDIQSSTNLTDWVPAGSVTITNLSGTVPIKDPAPPGADWKFYRAVGHP